MVRDLEQVHPGKARGEQLRVHVFLDVAHEQEPLIADASLEHDRHVVDAGPAVGRLRRDLAVAGPEHLESDVVDAEPIAGAEGRTDRRSRTSQTGQPRPVARAGAAHPGLEDVSDRVSFEQPRQTGDMVLVRVRQDDGVDAPIPRWQVSVERDPQDGWVGTAVDEQTTTAPSLHEDGIALPDIEDRHAGTACGAGHRHRACDRDGDEER